MHKVKISLFLVVVLVAFVVGGYATLSRYYGQKVRADLGGDLATATAAVARAKRLADHGQMAIAEEVCAWDKFPQKFAQVYPEGVEGKNKRHQDLWEELSVWSEKLKARRAKQLTEGTTLEDGEVHVPDLMYLADDTGEGVANLTDYGWWGLDISKQFPIVKAVGGLGRAVRDLWVVDGQMVEVTVCPVTGPDPAALEPTNRFFGSIVIGWILADGDADDLKALAGMDVLFFVKDKVHAGTLGTHRQGEVQRGILQRNRTAESGRVGADEVYGIGDGQYVAQAGLFHGYQSNPLAGYLLLADLGGALSVITQTAPWVALAAVVLIILCVVGVMFVMNQFTRPLVAIDSGIHEVINGNLDYWFEAEDKDTLAGAMAHSLNIMTCVLQGRPIPEDDEEIARKGGWEGEITAEGASGAPGSGGPSGGTTRQRPAAAGGLIPGLRAPAPKKDFAAASGDAAAESDAPADRPGGPSGSGEGAK